MHVLRKCIPFIYYNFLYSLQSQMDVDSGIETMEVDDQDVKFEIKRRRVKKKI